MRWGSRLGRLELLGRLEAERDRQAARRCARRRLVARARISAVDPGTQLLPGRLGGVGVEDARTRRGAPRPAPSRRCPRRTAGTGPAGSSADPRGSARVFVSSRSSRDLPTPAWPITVTRYGLPSRSTRSTRDCSSPASSLAADQRRLAHGRGRGRGSREHAGRLPRGDRLLLALQRERLEPLVGDRLPGCPVGRSPTVTLSGPPGGLEPRGDVDGVAHHRVAVADGARHHLAGVDADAQREADAVLLAALPVALLHRLLHREPRADGALRIVLVGDRSPEDAHHVVADELVDRAAEALDLLAEAAQGPVDERLDRLGVHPLGGRRIAGQVGEQDGRLAALLGRGLGGVGAPAAAGEDAPATDERPIPHSMQNFAPAGFSAPQLGQPGRSSRAARDAESGPLGILGPAARTSSPLHLE